MKSNARRYLVGFAPKRNPHFFADVLIIGGGLAGLRAAIAVDPSLTVVVATKDRLRESNSQYAQGGIAGVLDPEDRFEDHVEDTLAAGGTLCHRDVVEKVVREAPERIRELVGWGTQFDEADGAILLGREGGHSRNRIAHAHGDSTGKEIMRAVMQRVRELPNVIVWENSFTIDLLTDEGICRGAVIDLPSGGRTLVWAKQTILCTGGAGQVYRETTNPAVATADGQSIAFRAGAEVRDMEFMQFHPTVLYIAGSSRSLITEAVRGEGAYLLDRNGHRFMQDYDPRLELAPRDAVSRAIFSQMEKTRHPNVYLSLRHLDPEFVRERFPGIDATVRDFGFDVTRDLIPVRPGAHYMIGGVSVDLDGRTTLPGLWAAGEVTSSGLHGANRLASNSLLEGLVFGARAGELASQAALDAPERFVVSSIEANAPKSSEASLDVDDLTRALKAQMWRSVGVRRDREGLEEADEQLEAWSFFSMSQSFDSHAGWELQNLLQTATLMTKSALLREETRGVHWRADFPDLDPAFERHIAFRHGSLEPVETLLPAPKQEPA